MATNNAFLAMCSIIALILALLFILTAVGLIISIIVSKVHKNNVKPIRIIIAILSIVCAILSCAGYSAIHSQLISNVYGDAEDFFSIYDKDTESIVINGVTYVKTNEYADYDENTNIIGKYLISESDYYSSDGEIISSLFEVYGGDYYENICVYTYEYGGYDLIMTDYDYMIYCNEAQYDEYLECCKICNSLEWSIYSYENDYFHNGEIVTEITDEIQNMINELYEASGYDYSNSDYDESEFVKIPDEELKYSVSIQGNRESGLGSNFYEISYYEDSIYYFVDYYWDEESDTFVNIGYKLSDESTAVLKEMIELPDENE